MTKTEFYNHLKQPELFRVGYQPNGRFTCRDLYEVLVDELKEMADTFREHDHSRFFFEQRQQLLDLEFMIRNRWQLPCTNRPNRGKTMQESKWYHFIYHTNEYVRAKILRLYAMRCSRRLRLSEKRTIRPAMLRTWVEYALQHGYTEIQITYVKFSKTRKRKIPVTKTRYVKLWRLSNLEKIKKPFAIEEVLSDN